MALQIALPDRVICLMGNHEDMLLAAFDDSDWEEPWLRNGGLETLESYGVADAARIPNEHINWLRTLPQTPPIRIPRSAMTRGNLRWSGPNRESPFLRTA
jgi:hypothetical protein